MSTRPARFSSHRGLGVTSLLAMLAAPLAGPAAPVVVEETAKIVSPDPEYGWPIEVAIDGDWMIASGQKLDYSSGREQIDNSTWLYQRQANGA